MKPINKINNYVGSMKDDIGLRDSKHVVYKVVLLHLYGIENSDVTIILT